MGGADTQENIWFEPHAGTFGSLAKDKVELLLWRKVCVNKNNDSRSGENGIFERMDEATSPALTLPVAAWMG
jgi:hypothetical protein